MIKMSWKKSLFPAALIALSVSLNAQAEFEPDIESFPDAVAATEAAPAPDSVTSPEGVPDTETLSVEVTRTGEGVEVVIPDGRRVLLRNDHTWDYIEVEQGQPSESALLEVVNIQELRNACIVGLRMSNNLAFSIRSLVPSFTAFTTNGVRFETVSKAFSSINPTISQFQQIRFVGLRCQDIGHIQVHGADHCRVGQIDKFNDAEGECLSLIYVQASDLINISK
jgi:hypothetical protein